MTDYARLENELKHYAKENLPELWSKGEVIRRSDGFGNPMSAAFKSSDYRHQAMATFFCEYSASCKDNYISPLTTTENLFLEVVNRKAEYPRETRSLFAIHLLGREISDLGLSKLFVKLWLDLVKPGNHPNYPCAFSPTSLSLSYTPSNRQTQTPIRLIDAIRTDNYATFCIFRTLCSGETHLSRATAIQILTHHAINILICTLEDVLNTLSPEDVLFFCASSMPTKCIPIIDALESRHPGIVRNARDLYGNNALWYGLHRLGENRCAPEVEKHLIELGCDPESPNLLDLSYASMLKAKEYLNAI